MNIESFLPDLSCPLCGGSLAWEHTNSTEENGWLTCPACQARTPVMGGIVFFTETEMNVGDRRDLDRWREDLAGNDEKWNDYLEQRERRQTIDPYAAFAPFNEAHRAAIPMLDLLADAAPTDGVIVDLSNRTGWTGEFLAGTFPNCRVFAIWEGNTSVLGYRGFLRLMNLTSRSPNLLPIFSPSTLRPPIRGGTAYLVHAHDSLHRQDQPSFLNNCLALTRPDGTFLAPHVHLSNNQPSPFFERGGVLRHGRDYRDWLQERLRDDPRDVRVFSEVDLFNNDPQARSIDSADTDHYNGLVAVAPEELFDRFTADAIRPPEIQPHWRCLANPLLRINPLTLQCTIDTDALGSRAEYLLDRHPVYRRRLDRLATLRIDSDDLHLLSLTDSGSTLAEAAISMGEPLISTIGRCRRLAKHEILVPTPVTSAAVQLQRFHSAEHSIIDRNVIRSWSEWITADPNKEFGDILGHTITRAEADELLRVVLSFVSKLNDRTSIRMSSGAANSSTIALLSMAFLAAGTSLAEADEQSNLRFREDRQGDVTIERDNAADVLLSDVLAAFGADGPTPQVSIADPNWWRQLNTPF